MPTKQTVSLFLYLPLTKEVILARRAESESHSAMLQATIHGELEERETPQHALTRELYEESNLTLSDVKNLTALGEREVGDHTTEHCVYFMAAITKKKAAKIEPKDEISEFVFIKRQQLDQIITKDYAAENNINPGDAYVMFEDEREMLHEVFAHII